MEIEWENWQIINFSPFSVSRFGKRCCCWSSEGKIKNGLSSGHCPLEITVSKDGGEASSRGIIASFKHTQIRTAFYPCRWAHFLHFRFAKSTNHCSMCECYLPQHMWVLFYVCVCLFWGEVLEGKKDSRFKNSFKVSAVLKERSHRQIATRMVTFRLGLIWWEGAGLHECWESTSSVSPALQAHSLPAEPSRKPMREHLLSYSPWATVLMHLPLCEEEDGKGSSWR